jgi:hypothetical protein
MTINMILFYLRREGAWYLVEFRAGRFDLCVGAGFVSTFAPSGSDAHKELTRGRYRPEYSSIK